MKKIDMINEWGSAERYKTRQSAQSYMGTDQMKGVTSISTACGAGDEDTKPPSACGAGEDDPKPPSACGAGDDDPKPPSACGSGE